MLHSDIRHDFLRVHFGRLARPDRPAIARIFGELEREARATLERERFAAAGTALQRAVDLRYIGQQWDITVSLPSGELDVDAARSAFEAEHDRLFGHTQPGGTIEITKLRLAGIGRLPPLAPTAPPRAMGPAVATERRRVWLDAESGWVEMPVYRGVELMPGHEIAGPALIEERTTTVLIGAGDRCSVDAAGNFAVAIGSEA
jgi:N-methylhydantoinase A